MMSRGSLCASLLLLQLRLMVVVVVLSSRQVQALVSGRPGLQLLQQTRGGGCGGATRLWANPVTAEGSNYRGDITEEEAFLWFDEALVHVRAGSGGPGSSAVKFGKSRQHVAPTGGSGGNGGSVIFTVDSSFNTLLGFRGQSSFRAENGAAGDLEYQTGSGGKDFRVAVPLGTVVIDNSTNAVVGELTREGQELVVAQGGLGGRGNAALSVKGAASKCTPPEGGQRRWLKLELKLVADVGLVGVPNAGKSTLLDAITNAKPKIAPYPFTTIVPNLGVCEVGGSLADGGAAIVIADIPGLLEGAHRGVGLGRGFLRHVERCRLIVHIVNGDSPDPVRDFQAINRELQLFSPTLAAKPQVVVLNKVDLPHVAARQAELLAALRGCMPHARLLAVSAAGRVGTTELVDRTYRFLQKIKADDLARGAAGGGGGGGGAGGDVGRVRLVGEEEEVEEEGKEGGGLQGARRASDEFAIRVEKDGSVLLSGRAASIIAEEAEAAAAGPGSGSGSGSGSGADRLDAMVDALGLVEGIELTVLAHRRSRGAGELPAAGVRVAVAGSEARFLCVQGRLRRLA